MSTPKRTLDILQEVTVSLSSPIATLAERHEFKFNPATDAPTLEPRDVNKVTTGEFGVGRGCVKEEDYVRRVRDLIQKSTVMLNKTKEAIRDLETFQVNLYGAMQTRTIRVVETKRIHNEMQKNKEDYQMRNAALRAQLAALGKGGKRKAPDEEDASGTTATDLLYDLSSDSSSSSNSPLRGCEDKYTQSPPRREESFPRRSPPTAESRDERFSSLPPPLEQVEGNLPSHPPTYLVGRGQVGRSDATPAIAGAAALPLAAAPLPAPNLPSSFAPAIAQVWAAFLAQAAAAGSLPLTPPPPSPQVFSPSMAPPPLPPPPSQALPGNPPGGMREESVRVPLPPPPAQPGGQVSERGEGEEGGDGQAQPRRRSSLTAWVLDRFLPGGRGDEN